MAGTYSQIHIQIIFAVQGRANLISPEWKDELHRYISGIIEAKGQKPIIVNGMPDHIHAFLGLRPSMAVADLARDIKNNSSNFINRKGWVNGRFCWQEGYSAFSYAKSQAKTVYNYILNQEQHHKKKSFHEEYLSLLEEFKVEFDERYLFNKLD
jgi:putative transposase